MDEKQLFVKKLDELIKFARGNNNFITSAQMEEYFKGIELTPEKKQLIVNFLYDSKIGVDEPFDMEEVLDEEDVDFLQMYIDELDNIKKLTQKDKYAQLDKYVDGDSSLKEAVIESYLWDVVDMAKLYTGSGVSIEDLIGEGNVALAVMIESLDVNSKAKELDAFINDGIMSAMEELLYEDNNESNKSNSFAADANEVLEKAKELAETLGRNVRIDELCSFGDFEEQFVRNVLEVTGGIEIIEDNKNGQ